MAIIETVSAARLVLANALDASQTYVHEDLPGDPSLGVNWGNVLGFINIDMKTAAGTPSAVNPVEVAVSDEWSAAIIGSVGAATIDLTALVRDTCLGDLDLTGKKVQAYALSCPFTNTADVVMKPGATNGYDFLNSATSEIVVPPAGMVVGFFPENTTAGTGMPDVGAASAEIDFASAMADFVINCLLFAG